MWHRICILSLAAYGRREDTRRQEGTNCRNTSWTCWPYCMAKTVTWLGERNMPLAASPLRTARQCMVHAAIVTRDIGKIGLVCGESLTGAPGRPPRARPC
jgi:hypothetical protein